NAQLSNTQRQALDNLIRTGYTHSYPINPPRAWCTGTHSTMKVVLMLEYRLLIANVKNTIELSNRSLSPIFMSKMVYTRVSTFWFQYHYGKGVRRDTKSYFFK
ncbi:MAG: hypothetical protein WA461_05740, partial [Nitrososphaeraceae archaeon]